MDSQSPAIDKAKLRALEWLPKNLVSRAFGLISEVDLPPGARQVVNTTFAQLVGVNLSEAEHNPGAYKSLNAFFTRRLKPNARPIATNDPDAMVSPVDGRLTQFGPIVKDTMIQAKGKVYNLVELLDSAVEAEAFRRGHYATIYLSPKDYHRIHSPAQGVLEKVAYIPGHLWPVNPLSVNNIERLFAINERLITYLGKTNMERVAVIKVGATCVGRIGLSFDEFESNQGFRRRRDMRFPEAAPLDHGSELAVFNLGSTVILLIANPDFSFRDDLIDGQMLKMGELLGQLEAKGDEEQ